MGAETFCVTIKGASAEAAFAEAVRQAQYDHGHSGYSGTIAEKRDFVIVPLPDGLSPTEAVDLAGSDCLSHANQSAAVRAWVKQAEPIYDDKWGPALCFESTPGTFVFCGWASS